MQLPPLYNATLLRRYKRFLADLVLDDGREITAHCPNTGTMLGCWAPGVRAQVSHSNNPKRKLAWTLERIDMGNGWIGVHTGRGNALVAEAIAAGEITALTQGTPWQRIEREPTVKLPDMPPSRLDLLLHPAPDSGQRHVYIEIKNATLWQGDHIAFPDAVTQRGRKHLELLRQLAAAGHRSLLIFTVNRPEGDYLAPAWEIDPAYGEALARVVRHGVEVLALRVAHGEQTLTVGAALPVDLAPPGPLP